MSLGIKFRSMRQLIVRATVTAAALSGGGLFGVGEYDVMATK
jgi:hypothetical protein